MKNTARNILLIFSLWFVTSFNGHAQVLIVGDSVFCQQHWSSLLGISQVETSILTSPDAPFAMPDATVGKVLIVPPLQWFQLNADPEQISNHMESIARQMLQQYPSVRLYLSTALPSNNSNINRKQQEMVLLLLKDYAKHNKQVRFVNLYTPLTEKLNISVSPYPTSKKTRAEELAKKLRSPIPYREANQDLIVGEQLTDNGLQLVARILQKILKK